jgi:NAD(P)-dependent dehydrogenase (short-subunit alcohol dehydrogenase family)
MSKLQESIDALRVQFPGVDYRSLYIDLSDQHSVRTAAAELLSWTDIPTVDILVNSAGVSLFPERTLSVDGIEITFATNHIGHFLFTALIMPKIIAAAENNPKGSTRVVNVSSGSPMVARMRWSDINFEQKSKDLPEAERPLPAIHKAWGVENTEDVSYIPLEAYNVSKVASILFGIGINKRLYDKYGILSLGLHPGVIETELGRNATPEVTAWIKGLKDKGYYTVKSLGAGASTSLVAALDPELGAGETINGKENYGVYLADCQINERAQPLAVSSLEAEKLWELSQNLVKQKFDW